MNQSVKQNIQTYIHLEERKAQLKEELNEIDRKQSGIGRLLTEKVHEEFVFSWNEKFYSFLMDIDEGGVQRFREIENLDTWTYPQEPIGDSDDQ